MSGVVFIIIVILIIINIITFTKLLSFFKLH